MTKVYPDSCLTPQLWGTVGVEVETVFRSRQDVMGDLDFFGPYDRESGRPRKAGSPISMIFRDASVEGKFVNFKGTSIYVGKRAVRNIMQLPSYAGGSEIITLPLQYSVADEVVASILSALEAGGERFSPRSSIHFHFGFPKHLPALKRILALGLRTENLLYRLAGLGNRYRGSINHSVYARPLSSKTAVPCGNGKFAIIDPINALEAKNENDFWAVFMHTNGRPAVRYHPARYYGLNLYGLNLIGTVEFRMCNYSNNYTWVIAVMHLMQLITEIGALSSLKLITPLPTASLNDSRDAVVAFLTELNNLGAACQSDVLLSGDDIATLLAILERTPPPELNGEDIVRTHLKDFICPANDGYSERVYATAEETVASGHLSIHNIDEQDTSILD